MRNGRLMQSSSSTSGRLIKGYLPVRVKIPRGISSETTDETFFYVKEHRGVDGKKDNKTLFVTNAPVVPGVRTRILLQSLLGRFGDIDRVTVIANPQNEEEQAAVEWSSWTTTEFRLPSFLPPILSEGKFAHVVFASQKDMRRTLRALTQVMSADDDESQPLPGLSLETIELQTLADESDRQYREQVGMADESSSREDNNKSAVLKVADRYRASLHRLSRAALLEECNAVMQEFEDKEEEDRATRAAAASEPDEDGFVTVSYTSQIGSKRELEESAVGQRRRKGQKRSRKKKQGSGASELPDFYRFQTKEKRKRSLQDLRRQFEDDLAKVKKMKEDRQCRPF